MVCYSNYQIPSVGELTAISESILWLRMPLPFSLNHINLYLLKDTDGYYILDTGLNTPDTKRYWEQIIASLPLPIVGVIVTHMHPDHLGLAGWLCESHQCPLLMSKTEYFVGRAFRAGPNGADTESDKVYFRQAGADETLVGEMTKGSMGYSKVVTPIPVSYHGLKDQQLLTINNQQWRVLTFGGHAPEHVCLHNESAGVLIAGDQILPHISPNIGAYSTEPQAENLSDYLASLDVLALLPEDTLVLPAHGQPFTGIRERAATLKQHHWEHLDALTAFCHQSQTVMSCLPVMFKRELSTHDMGFAIAECLAHLNFLLAQQRLVRRCDTNGVYRYTTKK